MGSQHFGDLRVKGVGRILASEVRHPLRSQQYMPWLWPLPPIGALRMDFVQSGSAIDLVADRALCDWLLFDRFRQRVSTELERPGPEFATQLGRRAVQ